QGLKMLARDIAKTIAEREQRMFARGLVSTRIQPGPADTSIFNADNGVCIADDMVKQGIAWRPADKSPGSRKTGAEKLRARLTASCQSPMEDPGIFIFDTCRQWIRCVPVLTRDAKGNRNKCNSKILSYGMRRTQPTIGENHSPGLSRVPRKSDQSTSV